MHHHQSIKELSVNKNFSACFDSIRDYDTTLVTDIIKRYQELRSAAELVAIRYDRAGGSGMRTAKEEIICMLIDIDQAIAWLTPRQKAVIGMLAEGQSYELIGALLGIGITTAKFHARQGIERLVTFLNNY